MRSATKLKRLDRQRAAPGERIDVHSLDAIGLRLYKSHVGPATARHARGRRRTCSTRPRRASAATSSARHFLLTEWEQVVDAWQLDTWEAYRDVARLGRKTRLPEAQRAVLWSIFERVRAGLQEREAHHPVRVCSPTSGCSRWPRQESALRLRRRGRGAGLSVAHLRFFAALGADRPNALFFAGDLGQRIFQQPFSWKALGVDIRGRSRTLRVNYRTSHQIRMQADRLLGPEVTDVDGNSEERSTVSVFNGPPPVIRVLDTEEEEVARVSQWLSARAKEGVAAHEFGVFVRSAAELDRARYGSATIRHPVQGSRRERRDDQRSRLHQHHAPGQGTGVPRRRRDGLRR